MGRKESVEPLWRSHSGSSKSMGVRQRKRMNELYGENMERENDGKERKTI